MPLPNEPDLLDRILPSLLPILGMGGLAFLNRQTAPKAPPGPMQKLSESSFGKPNDVPLPPVRPYPSNDPYDAIENQRATNPLQSLNPLADPRYVQEQVESYPDIMANSSGAMNAIAPSFGTMSQATVAPPMMESPTTGWAPEVWSQDTEPLMGFTGVNNFPVGSSSTWYDPGLVDYNFNDMYSTNNFYDYGNWATDYNSNPYAGDDSWRDIDFYNQPSYDFSSYDSGGYWW